MYVDIKISLKNILSKEPQTQSNNSIATSPIDIKLGNPSKKCGKSPGHFPHFQTLKKLKISCV